MLEKRQHATAPLPRDRPPPPTWVIVLMMAVIGLNLRATLGAIPPLLNEISADLNLNATMEGLLTSIAVICMGICAPIGQRVAARRGAELTTVFILATLALGGLMRLAATSTALMVTSIVVTGAAMGAGSALVPGLIRHHAPKIRGTTTGIYSGSLAIGVALAAGLAVPSSDLLGGWRPALAVWGAFAALTAVVWAAMTPRLLSSLQNANDEVEPAGLENLPWKSRTAWWVVLFYTGVIIVGFSGLAWIIPLYVEIGETPEKAASLFIIFQIAQLGAMLTLPAITDFTADRRPMLAISIAAECLGIAGLVVAPQQLAVASLVLFGIGLGGGFALGLVLIVDYTTSQREAARLGAMTMLVGYIFGASGPLILGVLFDVTNGFTAGYLVVLLIGIATLAIVPVFRPGRQL